jgi:hypothetical protein
MGIQHAKKKVNEFREICVNEGFGVYIKARMRSGKEYLQRGNMVRKKTIALRNALAKEQDIYAVQHLDKAGELEVLFSSDGSLPGKPFVEVLWDLEGHEYSGANAIDLLKQDEYDGLYQDIVKATYSQGDNFGLSPEELEEEGKRLRGGSFGSAA